MAKENTGLMKLKRSTTEGKKVAEQIMEKIKNSKSFREKINRISNGQIILFVKHTKINLVRCTEDEIFDEIKE